jgi:Uma2 family endonuclease
VLIRNAPGAIVGLDGREDYMYPQRMAITEQLMDADTFLARPESISPREELIDGRLVVSEPRPLHQLVTVELLVALRRWIDAAPGRGVVVLPIDLRISDLTVLVPDLLWYADPGRIADAPAQLQPPDLVVEVRSPSTWDRDLGVKSERYAGWAVKELWLVDPEARTVLVRRRSEPRAPRFDRELALGRKDTLASPLLPGFALRVRDVFDRAHQK